MAPAKYQTACATISAASSGVVPLADPLDVVRHVGTLWKNVSYIDVSWAHQHLPIGINAVNLNPLRDIETNCCDRLHARLLRIVGLNSAHFRGVSAMHTSSKESDISWIIFGSKCGLTIERIRRIVLRARKSAMQTHPMRT